MFKRVQNTLYSLQFYFAFAYTALANRTKFFAERHNELVSVDDAFRIQLVDVGSQHLLKGRAKSIFRELEVLVHLQQVLHLFDSNSSLIFSVHGLEYQRQVQLF
jgi:hypothetical protein